MSNLYVRAGGSMDGGGVGLRAGLVIGGSVGVIMTRRTSRAAAAIRGELLRSGTAITETHRSAGCIDDELSGQISQQAARIHVEQLAEIRSVFGNHRVLQVWSFLSGLPVKVSCFIRELNASVAAFGLNEFDNSAESLPMRQRVLNASES